MSEKINSKELAKLMASHPGVSLQASNAFLEAFQDVFEEALLRDKVVKVNGVGTFKLVWHAPRKSVNVRTGDEMEIAGHYKISFLPDGDWNTKVNEPMAHLEAVELPGEGDVIAVPTDTVEDIDSEMPLEENGGKADDYVLPMEHLNEQVTEVKSLLAGIMGDSANMTSEPGESSDVADVQESIEENAVEEDSVAEETIEINIPQIKEVSDLVFEIQAVPEVESNVEPNQEQTVDDVSDELSEESEVVEVLPEAQQEEPVVETVAEEQMEETEAKDDSVKEEPQVPKEQDNEPQEPTKHKTRIWPWLVGVLCLLVVAGLGYYFYNTYYTGDNNVPENLIAEESVKPVDSLVNVAEETVEEVVFDSTYYFPPETGYEVYDIPRKYTDYIAYRTVTSEDRLVTLALQYYGHKFFWVYIYEANRDVLSHPDKLTVGQQLKIPQIDTSLIDTGNSELMEYVKKLGDVYVGK